MYILLLIWGRALVHILLLIWGRSLVGGGAVGGWRSTCSYLTVLFFCGGRALLYILLLCLHLGKSTCSYLTALSSFEEEHLFISYCCEEHLFISYWSVYLTDLSSFGEEHLLISYCGVSIWERAFVHILLPCPHLGKSTCSYLTDPSSYGVTASNPGH